MENFVSWTLRRRMSDASPIVKEHLDNIPAKDDEAEAEILRLAELGARVVKLVLDGEKVPF
jgi:hypothetical protein